MTNAYLDLHVVQSVPPSNINRDDTGSPKSAVYGGVPRARVSSQAWKRAVRTDFSHYLDETDLGVRSKRLVAKIADRITDLDGTLKERSEPLAAAVLTALGIQVDKPKPKRGAKENTEEQDPSSESGYLIFLSNRQINNLAEYAVTTERAGGTLSKKEAAVKAQQDHSFDIALFGRMVAEITDLRVDAAAQVAHAISVHRVDNEFDYFTAVDDNATGEHAGAGMIGTIEFNSSTLYRYATVNLNALALHLGDAEATGRATEAFVASFVRSLPTGKQNTFANRTLPQAIVAVWRTDQPVNLVGAFEDPVVHADGVSRLAVAAHALVDHTQRLAAAYGTPEDNRTWVVAASKDAEPLVVLGESVDLGTLVAGVGRAARQHAERQ